MRIVQFDHPGREVLELSVSIHAIVLTLAETQKLEDLGGFVGFIDAPRVGAVHGECIRYKPFVTTIKGHTVLILHGWREDKKNFQPIRLLKEAGFEEEISLLEDLPCFGELILPRIPRKERCVYVLVDRSRNPRYRLAGKVHMAYRLATGEAIVFGFDLKPSEARVEWEGSSAAIIRARKSVADDICSAMSSRYGSTCTQKVIEVPSFDELLARRAYSLVGYRLTGGRG